MSVTNSLNPNSEINLQGWQSERVAQSCTLLFRGFATRRRAGKNKRHNGCTLPDSIRRYGRFKICTTTGERIITAGFLRRGFAATLGLEFRERKVALNLNTEIKQPRNEATKPGDRLLEPELHENQLYKQGETMEMQKSLSLRYLVAWWLNQLRSLG
jgi:hypothetical protein